ncbi:hypothetical protein DJ73_07205 [Halorubrum sp. Ea1]|uniref:hypothetical protein n=1 Tax=Halorubrum sp. Ea1 TaxID=1480718 RepID=UPI000B99B140|nr:hypothetical protein [Halorubrum sp. Ea1]OYR53589.1 hypothetical protein DJ73_07205 [Halorubrum sp. Ea1]
MTDAPTTNAMLRQTYLGRVAGDPPVEDLNGGEVWFDTESNTYRGYDGTSLGEIGFTADA